MTHCFSEFYPIPAAFRHCNQRFTALGVLLYFKSVKKKKKLQMLYVKFYFFMF